MTKITTFLTFNDRAEEAAAFYTSVFKRSKIVSSTRYGDTGPGAKGQLMTATIELDGQELILLNGGPQFTFSQGISLMVQPETQDEIDYYWDKLSEGGSEGPCGWLKDRYGLSWQVTPRDIYRYFEPADSPAAARAFAAMMTMKKLDIDAIRRAYEGVTSRSTA